MLYGGSPNHAPGPKDEVIVMVLGGSVVARNGESRTCSRPPEVGWPTFLHFAYIGDGRWIGKASACLVIVPDVY